MAIPGRRISSVSLLSLWLVGTLSCWMATITFALKEKEQSPSQKTKVRRENSLDHWDSDTLAYYLDNYPGYDLAVMFYAQWDTNSHQLAPYWNQIAVALDAGSVQSNLIMALFDCELNAAHMELCAAAGVTHYPTLMFIGSGKFYDTDPFSKLLLGKQAAGMMGESPIPNTVKYQGNWQYFDSILDWIKAMQGLSRLHKWNTEGFGKRLRTFLLPRKKKNGQLPLGIPGGSSSISGSSDGTAGASGSSGRDTTFLEAQVDKWKKSADDMTKVATKAATMMDTLLFSENYTDMFTFLDEQNAWNDVTTYKNMGDIYRACVLETSIDYCQRLSDPVGTKVVDDLVASDLTNEELVAASDDIEKLILEALAKKEPYCAILDSCIRDGLKDPACRPKTCPFANDLACRMLTSCQDPSIIKEYADALKLDIDTLLPQASASK